MTRRRLNMAHIPQIRLTRRRLLASFGVSLVPLAAGCLSGDKNEEEREGPAESRISVLNRTTREHEVSFVVHDEDTDTRVVDETVEIPAETRHKIPFSVETGDDDSVSVRGVVELVDPPDGVAGENLRDEKQDTLRVSQEGSFDGEIEDGRGIRLGTSTV